MQRRVLGDIESWNAKNKRKPLVLMGARQVGKTWLMEEFSSWLSFRSANSKPYQLKYKIYQSKYLNMKKLMMLLCAFAAGVVMADEYDDLLPEAARDWPRQFLESQNRPSALTDHNVYIVTN